MELMLCMDIAILASIRETYFNITFLLKLIMGLGMLSLGKMKMRFNILHVLVYFYLMISHLLWEGVIR